MADVGRALATRIAADGERPTGIVAVNDLLAFGLLANPSIAPAEFLFKPDLVERESVAAPGSIRVGGPGAEPPQSRPAIPPGDRPAYPSGEELS